MTKQEFVGLVEKPLRFSSHQLGELKELIEAYPYFTIGRLLYLRALQESDNILFESALEESGLHVRDRSWFYNYVYPEKKELLEGRKNNRSKQSNGDYFDMIQKVESKGEDIDLSLKKMAERLKEARDQIFQTQKTSQINSRGSATTQTKVEEKPASDLHQIEEAERAVESLRQSRVMEKAVCEEFEYSLENYQDKIRELMKKREYEKALEILRELYLNNSEKNVYFADQIRFVEKIIDNT